MQCNPNSLVIGIKVALLSLLGWVAAGAALGTAPGAHAQADARERLSYLDTLTATPTATPSGEPEWDILQYVVTANPSRTCSPINGTPGDRTLNCFTGAGHSGAGTVDNYGDPGSASANWMQRRTNALATYPVFWNRHPGMDILVIMQKALCLLTASSLRKTTTGPTCAYSEVPGWTILTFTMRPISQQRL